MPNPSLVGDHSGLEHYATFALYWAAEWDADYSEPIKAICKGNVGGISTTGVTVHGYIIDSDGVEYDGTNHLLLPVAQAAKLASPTGKLSNFKLDVAVGYTKTPLTMSADDLLCNNFYISGNIPVGQALNLYSANSNRVARNFVIDATGIAPDQVIPTGYNRGYELYNFIIFGGGTNCGGSAGVQKYQDGFSFNSTTADYNTAAETTNAASEDGTGSTGLTGFTSAELVDFDNGDYRTKATSVLATAGTGGSFVGAFLELSGVEGEAYSGSTSFNTSTTVINSGVKSLNTAAQISAVTTSLVKGNKYAQASADLTTTSNLISTGSKRSFSVAQTSTNSAINTSGVKHTFGASNINVATSFTISGTAAELIIKSGAASLLAVTSMNSIGYKSSYSNVAITELTNINVAGYKYTLASASINITTNELSSGRKSSQGKKSESQTTVLNSLGAKYSFGNNSLSTSTITMAMGVGGSFVPISRKTIIPGRINSLVLNGQISSGLTIQGIF